MTPRLLLAGISVLLLTSCTSSRADSAGAGAAASAEPVAPPLAIAMDEPTAATTAPASAPAVKRQATLAAARTRPATAAAGSDIAPAESPEAAVAKATATGALAPPAPAQPAPVQPLTMLEQFDAELIALTKDDAATAAPAAGAFTSLPVDERQLLGTVIAALGRFRAALHGPQGLLGDKAAPLIDLAEELNAQAPLALTTVALCRSVTQFGVYDPIEPMRFIAGQETPTIVYCEVEHFRSDPASNGRYQTKLTYEASLFSDSDHGVSVITRKPADVVDLCRNRRRDFFLADRLTLPSTLPVGRYLLKVSVVDQLANRVAEKTVPIIVAPAE